MATHSIRTRDKDSLARFLGWFSVGLGAAQLTAPRAMCRLVGASGTVSIVGVYGGVVDKFPIGAVMNRGLTIRSGQCHVHRYLRPLLERIERGEIDPSFVVTHHLPLDAAPRGYELFKQMQDDCLKVVLKP